MNKLIHKLEITAVQTKENENGAHVNIVIEGSHHVLVAAIAGLLETDHRLIELLHNAMQASEKGMVKTFDKMPNDEECPCPTCSSQDVKGGENNASH